MITDSDLAVLRDQLASGQRHLVREAALLVADEAIRSGGDHIDCLDSMIESLRLIRTRLAADRNSGRQPSSEADDPGTD